VKFCWRNKIQLPGFTIHIQFTDDRGLSGIHGDWDYNMKKGMGVIRIHSGAPEAIQRRVFAHEMQHAMVDYLHYICPELLDNGKG